MKFDNLLIENFLAIGHAQIDLADRGLVSVEGVNEDDSSAVSNGAGKSSIADALCWCLYGVTARGEVGDAVINSKAGKGTRVQVQAVEGDYTYLIKRHRKHKYGKNMLCVQKIHVLGGTDDLTKGTDKLTQEVVEEIIGCTYEVFRSSIYAGQDQMPDLPGMTDKQLKVLVEEAAGTTILEKAYEEARTRLGQVSRDAAEAQSALARDKERLSDLHTQLFDTDAARARFVLECREEAKKMVEQAKVLLGEIAGWKKVIKSKNKSLVEARIVECDDQLGSLSVERETERTLAKDEKHKHAWVVSLTHALTTHKTLIERERRDYEQIKDRVGAPCGECGKPYCEHDLGEAKRLAGEKLKARLRDYRDTERELGIATDAHKSAADALEKHRASMSDATTLSAQRASLSDELREIEALEQAIKANTAQVERYKQHATQILTRKNPHEATIDRLEKQIADIKDLACIQEAKIEGLNETVTVNETLVKVFSPAGVRAHILDTVTPFLNGQTAKYLSTLSDGNIEATWSTLTKTAKGDWREKFAIEVKNAKGGASFGLISGGEKRKVRIATALALQDLVASRASKPIELFIGDEIDDALDAAGLERLMMILQEKARERGSVFVISHNSGIRDWISNVVTVTRKDGVSTIEEATV